MYEHCQSILLLQLFEICCLPFYTGIFHVCMPSEIGLELECFPSLIAHIVRWVLKHVNFENVSYMFRALKHKRFLILNLLFCCHLAPAYENWASSRICLRIFITYALLPLCTMQQPHAPTLCTLPLPVNVWLQWLTKRLNRQLNSISSGIRFHWWMSRNKRFECCCIV